ncbi:MAG: hypothetical protein AAFY71_21435 [Bacteroidota bacterium]
MANIPFQVDKMVYDSFPEKQDIVKKVCDLYQTFIWGGEIELLNEPQQVMTYFYCMEEVIWGKGIYEAMRIYPLEWLLGYLNALNTCGNQREYDHFLEVIQLYQRYQSYFFKGEIPPALVAGSSSYDVMMDENMEDWGMIWLDKLKERNDIFYEYLRNHKDQLIRYE